MLFKVLRNGREVSFCLDLLLRRLTVLISDARAYMELLDEKASCIDGFHHEERSLSIFVSEVDWHVELGYQRAQEIKVVVARSRVDKGVPVLVLTGREGRCLA